jgi:hypothetical protein
VHHQQPESEATGASGSFSGRLRSGEPRRAVECKVTEPARSAPDRHPTLLVRAQLIVELIEG